MDHRYYSHLSYSDARRSMLHHKQGDGVGKVRVALAGNCSMQFMVPGLDTRARARELSLDIEVCPFDAWIPAALNGTVSADFWVIWQSSLGLTAGATQRRPGHFDGIASAVEQLVARGARVVMLLPEALESERDPFSGWHDWRRQAVVALTAAMPPEVIQLCTETIQRELAHTWHSGRYWTTAKCPAHPDAMTSLGAIVAEVIAATIRPRVKAVITDLDNTLWGGVVGEEGVHGLELDPHSAGRPFLALQRFLKDLSTKGVPICVASKNDPADALAAFSQRKEMILSAEDITHFCANWRDKHHNIVEILSDLRLTADSVCFLDDSPVERDQARSHIPGLIVPEIPDDPEERLAYLMDLGLFIRPQASREDSARVEYYKADAERRSLYNQAADSETYLKSLDIRLTARAIDARTLARCVDLIHKTNQFNLTFLRWDRTEVNDFAACPENYAVCFEYRDRFGDAGIIAVALGRPDDNGNLEIPIFLMSCRVINRGVEDAVLAHMASWSAARGYSRLVGLYRPTEKNLPCADFYSRHGFIERGNAGDLLAWVSDGLVSPRHPVQFETEAPQ